MNNPDDKKYWLVSAKMGYGHHRAIYPLLGLAEGGKIIEAGSIQDASPGERRFWAFILWSYESISRGTRIPVIGGLIKCILNRILFIPDVYPENDRSYPTFKVRLLRTMIRKGLGSGIIRHINVRELPVITSFYAPLIATEIAGFKEICCMICDTDLNRVWVAAEPSKSTIIYFAPDKRSFDRLLSYGVPEKNIVLTGFPLPLELLGDRNLDILKSNLQRRLRNLDPFSNFFASYGRFVSERLGNPEKTTGITGYITLTFAVGGAGAQKEIGGKILRSLAGKLKDNQIKINLVAGTRYKVYKYFRSLKKRITDNSSNVRIIYSPDVETYFRYFNECLHSSDILWSKPGELSFYTALGLPLIISPPLGPQEEINRLWLLEKGSGIDQMSPGNADKWLIDLIDRGSIAEAAWNGYLNARKYGTYNIIDYLQTGTFTEEFTGCQLNN